MGRRPSATTQPNKVLSWSSGNYLLGRRTSQSQAPQGGLGLNERLDVFAARVVRMLLLYLDGICYYGMQ